MRISAGFVSLLLVAASAANAGVYSQCEHRDETTHCDARYDPVCANWDTRIRCIQAPCPSAEQRLYTNACLACLDERVTGYTDGECGERSLPESVDRVRIGLPELERRYTHKDRSKAVDVRMNTPFARVTRAWISMEGEARPGSAELVEPADGMIEIPVRFQIVLQDGLGSGVIDIGRPTASMGPFDGPFKAEGHLAPKLTRASRNSWTILEDGETKLELSWSAACPAACLYREDAVVQIQRAMLIVEGLIALQD